MNYQQLLHQLESFPITKQKYFEEIHQLTNSTTPATVLQLLNILGSYLPATEVYCEIGCAGGASLISALSNNPECLAYGVDRFSSNSDIERLQHNLLCYGVQERSFIFEDIFESFFIQLYDIKPEEKIGFYFYDAASDYRSHLLGLLLVEPFLASEAIVVVQTRDPEAARQAIWDFLTIHPVAKWEMDGEKLNLYQEDDWQQLYLLSWQKDRKDSYDWQTIEQNWQLQVLQEVSLAQKSCEEQAYKNQARYKSNLPN